MSRRVVDTSAPISAATLPALVAATPPVAGVIRTISHNPGFEVDNLTPGEVTRIEAAVPLLGAYAMFRASGWCAAAGTADGVRDAANAVAAGLGARHFLALDLEGSATRQEWLAHALAWLDATKFLVTSCPPWGQRIRCRVVYVAGNAAELLTSADLDAIAAAHPDVEFWTAYDAATRAKAGCASPARGWTLAQGLPVKIGGALFDDGQGDESLFATSSPTAVTLPAPRIATTFPTAFAKRLAAAARNNAPCDSRGVNVDGYTLVNVRPGERTPAKRAYYYENRWLSTCGLWGGGCARVGGLTDAEFSGPYGFNAVVDVQTVAQRHGVLEMGTPTAPPCEGDEIVITDANDDAHLMVCVGPTTVQANGTWLVSTSEGGQSSGQDSSASGCFVRTISLVGGKRMVGQRYIYCIARFSRLEVADPTPAPLPTYEPSATAVTLPELPSSPSIPPPAPTAPKPPSSKPTPPYAAIAARLLALGGALATTALDWVRAHPLVLAGAVVAAVVALLVVEAVRHRARVAAWLRIGAPSDNAAVILLTNQIKTSTDKLASILAATTKANTL